MSPKTLLKVIIEVKLGIIVHYLNKYLLNSHYALCTTLGTGDRAEWKADKVLALTELTLQRERMIINKSNK